MTEELNTNDNQPTPADFALMESTPTPPVPRDVIRFKGRKVKPEELPENQAEMHRESQDLTSLYEKMVMEFREGEIVKGKIIAIGDKEISVDIGFKSEGTVSTDEFGAHEPFKVGDDIEVFLDRVEDAEGQLLLSKKKADFLKIWARIGGIYKDEEIVRGRIMRRIKGGFVVDLMTVDAFLPGSQIDVHPVRDFDALVGQDMDFRIVKLNDARKNIVVSHKIIVEKSLAGIREKVLGELKVGDIMEGTVKNITDFGVFVDLGGVDGLLHITDLSWGRVSHPSEVVQLDQRITVKVLDYDKDRQRISIGLKQLQAASVGRRGDEVPRRFARAGPGGVDRPLRRVRRTGEGPRRARAHQRNELDAARQASVGPPVGGRRDRRGGAEYRQGKPQDFARPEAGGAGSVGKSRNQVFRRVRATWAACGIWCRSARSLNWKTASTAWCTFPTFPGRAACGIRAKS